MLAGKADGDGLRTARAAGVDCAVVIAAALSQPDAVPVDADNGNQHFVQPFGADFFAAKLGDVQAALAAFAFGALGFARIGREPEAQGARFDIGQVNVCAAFQSSLHPVVQIQFAAHRPINGDVFAALDKGFQRAVAGCLRFGAFGCGQCAAGLAQLAAQGFFGRFHQPRPVLPKPPVPRSLAANSSTSAKSACTTGTITIWAMRSKGSMTKLSLPRFHTDTISSPW